MYKEVHLELLPKRVAAFFFISKLLRFKNAISFQILKNMHFTPFSVAYYFLIDFSKNLQFTFPCSQPSLLNIVRNWKHWIECISHNVHKILILHPKLHKKVAKNLTISKEKRSDLQIFRNFSSQWIISMLKISRNLKFLTWYPWETYHGMTHVQYKYTNI